MKSHGVNYVFPCGKWLSKKHDDGLLERELLVSSTESQLTDIAATYVVTVKTSDVAFAGTDAKVALTLYGDKGKTESVELKNKSDNFERNQVRKSEDM